MYMIDLNGEDMTRNFWLGQYLSAALASIIRVGSMLYFFTYLTAYNSISVSWEPNFLGAAELMPTDVRAKTTALLNIISRLANVLASQMIYFKTIYEPAIMIALMISNIFSFIVTITWLKETKNIKLDESGGGPPNEMALEQAKSNASFNRKLSKSNKVGNVDRREYPTGNDDLLEEGRRTH
ncbi:hypothetical protein TELCIR_14050 [Teladorsagia circumcincta]|uniref:Uncharacterized protein n=1 Tax=Teladorsagia circumcincta TaxID=45464 RepID=A0A2G9U234_TELCI|nr:hypothetical protein TELCIR_14050 [Teladorsagia circumcincta]